MLTTLFSFIVVIGIIVFVHEFGHFIAAKLSGVRVEIFSLGFPPKMIGKKIGDTEYQLAWIPLGGFVKMTGMIDESMDDDFDPEDPMCFVAQPFYKRAFIITAGVIMNFILGFVIYTGITWSEGVGTITENIIDQVVPGSIAEVGGILPGDRIIEVDGVQVTSWEELTQEIRNNPGEEINVKWMRDDIEYSELLIPEPRPSLNFKTGRRDTVGQLGIGGLIEVEPVSFISSIGYGFTKVIGILELNYISVKWLVTGQAKIRELSGPIGIAKMSGDSVRSGFAVFFGFIAYISISIGFLNILPIPMLDGGHLFFMIIEAIIRRPIPEKVKMNLMKVGLAALLLLIIVVSYHDIVRFFISN